MHPHYQLAAQLFPLPFGPPAALIDFKHCRGKALPFAIAHLDNIHVMVFAWGDSPINFAGGAVFELDRTVIDLTDPDAANPACGCVSVQHSRKGFLVGLSDLALSIP